MTEPLKERVEAKAKELYEIHMCHKALYKDSSRFFRCNWEILAKDVMISDVKARIDELNLQSNRLGLCADDAMERINELTAELNELERGEL